MVAELLSRWIEDDDARQRDRRGKGINDEELVVHMVLAVVGVHDLRVMDGLHQDRSGEIVVFRRCTGNECGQRKRHQRDAHPALHFIDLRPRCKCLLKARSKTYTRLSRKAHNPSIRTVSSACGCPSHPPGRQKELSPRQSSSRRLAPVSSPPPRAYEVCYWHKADVDFDAEHVRFRGQ